jgi:hypothetical protein
VVIVYADDTNTGQGGGHSGVVTTQVSHADDGETDLFHVETKPAALIGGTPSCFPG